MLPLGQVAAYAQGDAAAGKAYWDRGAPRATACHNCHGNNAEGAFGPDLAGRGLNVAQVIRAVRQPWGIMPAFVESQMSDKDAADLTAYFASLPKPAEIAALEVYPAKIALKGSDDAQQIVLTAKLAGDRLCDLSSDATYEVADAKVVRVTTTGRVIPLANEIGRAHV